VSAPFRTVLLDVDGTLVDSNFHHAIAWQRAFHGIGIDLPAWRLLREIGKGGDKYVVAVAGERVEEEHGDEARALHGDHFGELIDEVRPLPGARELIVALRERGVETVIASSGEADEVEHYVDLLDARELLQGWTSSGDVEQSKPAPDLLETALERASARPALLIGDAVWDGEAARNAGIGFAGLRSGGNCAADLREAGAIGVWDDAAALAADLDRAGIARS
jgi:phosphoglycolate phosphatase-like HAD superfamily hydrolase